MRGASASVLVEFADEASEETQNRRLTLHLGVELRGGVRDGIRVRKTVLRQIGLGGSGVIAESILSVRNVRDQNVLVILAAARNHGGDKGDAEAAALIAE